MPLIAREIVIKVTVQEDGAASGNTSEASGNSASQGATTNPDSGGTGGGAQNQDVISACVEQVMEILREKIEP